MRSLCALLIGMRGQILYAIDHHAPTTSDSYANRNRVGSRLHRQSHESEENIVYSYTTCARARYLLPYTRTLEVLYVNRSVRIKNSFCYIFSTLLKC